MYFWKTHFLLKLTRKCSISTLRPGKLTATLANTYWDLSTLRPTRDRKPLEYHPYTDIIHQQATVCQAARGFIAHLRFLGTRGHSCVRISLIWDTRPLWYPGFHSLPPPGFSRYSYRDRVTKMQELLAMLPDTLTGNKFVCPAALPTAPPSVLPCPWGVFLLLWPTWTISPLRNSTLALQVTPHPLHCHCSAPLTTSLSMPHCHTEHYSLAFF